MIYFFGFISQKISILALKVIKEGQNEMFRGLIWGIVRRCMSNITGDTLVDIYQGIGSFSVWRFGLYSPNHVFYRKYVLISIEALICGYLEPKKLMARPPNQAAMPL